MRHTIVSKEGEIKITHNVPENPYKGFVDPETLIIEERGKKPVIITVIDGMDVRRILQTYLDRIKFHADDVENGVLGFLQGAP